MEIDPVKLGAGLTKDYRKAQQLFRRAMARQFVLGRELVDLRERLGAVAFTAWMKRYCGDIPLADADALMHYSLSSGLAEKVDAVLDVQLDAESGPRAEE